MKMFTAITFLSAITLAWAEPPVPHNSYLAPNQGPSNQYLAPQQSYQDPTNTYLPPNRGAQVPPSNSYGAPFAKPQGNSGYRNGGGNSGYGGEENYGPAKYEFKYDVQDYESGNDFGHMETRDGDLATGRYYVLLPDGRKQIVEYEADANGYRPTIRYEQVNAGQSAGGGYNAAGGSSSGKFAGYQ